jgi:beta-galactosidase GanA
LIYSYVNEQADAIREYSKAPIGTDMMTDDFLDYNKMNKTLDVVQHNHYNTVNNLYRIIFNYDFYRTLKERPFWVTETLLGWNGSIAACNGYRNVGYCYINSLLPIAHGAEMNLYWLFRSHPNGHEMGHGAFLNSNGRPNNVAKSVKMITDTLTKGEDFLLNSKVKSKLALTYSGEAFNMFLHAPIVEKFDQDVNIKFVNNFNKALRHYNIDVIETDKDLGEYDTIISPFLACTEYDNFKEKIVEWIEYKKEKKQSYKKKGFEAFCRQRMEEVNKYGDRYVIESIDYSMCQNYSGVFPPKVQLNAKTYGSNGIAIKPDSELSEGERVFAEFMDKVV